MYINTITSLVAADLTPLSALAEKYAWGERNTRIFGRFHRMESASLFEHGGLPDLMMQLLQQFRAECDPVLFEQIGYVVWAHSLNSPSPFDLGPVLANKVRSFLGRTEVEFFSVTQASCASALVGLKFLDAKLAAAHARQENVCGLLITGEKCFHGTVQYVNQNGFFGEAFCATLLSARPSPGALCMSGMHVQQLAAYGTRTRETSRERENAYDHAFIPTMLETVNTALLNAGRRPEELRTLIPYHISPPTFDRIADAAGFSRDIIYRRHLYQLGHCFCSDTFLNLKSLLTHRDNAVAVGPILAVASGIAGTFAAVVLELNNEDQT
ncbi:MULTISPECIES: beta-ketoacyl-[acyl-carrier-protein] synthase family protein [Pseudomonas]|uniref:3-oxoacyl-ACP synthase n=1 Tax=Pseudomonas TaxID=286 RepID=UPI0008122F2B|nr:MULTISPECIES: 3-oxoacyl-ACP synthase [unclassified Pseudomonas]MBW8128763.1 3-oxoacyl-ACP synthase [Pseudomonas sp. LAP_36]MBW8137681.1 3-oxoacyl-ACP synthase [Pseudomonas sp. PAMC 26818]CRL98624.1 3-oxoacyl-[acyl-carrier-protein] synthase III [Pseudomonas sp. 24 R 17]